MNFEFNSTLKTSLHEGGLFKTYKNYILNMRHSLLLTLLLCSDTFWTGTCTIIFNSTGFGFHIWAIILSLNQFLEYELDLKSI